MRSTFGVRSIVTGFMLFAAYLAAPARAQVVQEWENRFDHGVDGASSIAYSNGAVFVTGYQSSQSGQAYVTQKIDASTGATLWTATYQGSTGYHWATDIAVDSSGDVYITGRSVGVGTGYDYATVKYNGATGAQVWASRYNGPANGDDKAEALVLGNNAVYVTGSSTGVGTGTDIATIRYDAGTGAAMWTDRYDGPGAGADGGADIEYIAVLVGGLSLAGNGWVFVTGDSAGSGTSSDCVTIRHNAGSGSRDWVSRYDGPASGDDLGMALAIDGFGNSYVTGRSAGVGTGVDYATLKYSHGGVLQWVSRYDGPVSGADWGHDIGVYPFASQSGQVVYVTGGSVGAASWDFATLRLDAGTGVLTVPPARFNSVVGGDDRGVALAIDSAGNCYVTGRYRNNRSFWDWDYATLKYDAAMTLLWDIEYNGFGNHKDIPAGIAIDQASPVNVFVTGFSVGFGQDLLTLKYSQ